MELQISNKESATLPSVDGIITKFYKDLLNQLSLDSELLKNSCIENSEQINSLRQEKLQLFKSMCNDNNSPMVSNEFAFIFHMSNNSDLLRHSLQYGLEKVEEGVVRHNESCKEWKRAVEQKLEAIQDNFTMMPYHDVEMEINAITLEVNEIRKKIQDTTEKTQARNSEMEVEFKQLLSDVAIMEPYEKEIRNAKEQLEQELSDKRRRQQLEAFHSNIGSQNITEIEKEIDELQKQISALKEF